MKVDKVQSAQQTSLAFKGYVGNGLREYINAAVKKEVGDVVEIANQASQRADMQRIFDIKALGDGILIKFEKYLAKMNKDTVLDLNNINNSYPGFVLSNKIEPNKTIRVMNWYLAKKAALEDRTITVPKFKDLNEINKANIDDLMTLDEIIGHLRNINPRDIDKTFLNWANYQLKSKALQSTGFFQKMAVRKYARKIDAFAKSIGEDTTAETRVERYIEKAAELKNQRTERKAIANSNRKEAERILKGK